MTIPNTRPVGMPPAGHRCRRSTQYAPIKDALHLGLSPDQSVLFEAATTGNHLYVTGPGGAGKTTVLMRFLQFVHTSQDTPNVVFCLTPNPATDLRRFAPCFHPGEVESLINEALAQRSLGLFVRLLVDEHISISPRLLAELINFDQIILLGDPHQGSFDRQSRLARQLRTGLSARTISIDTVWRSSNQFQFNTLNALVYQSRYESIGSATDSPPEQLRQHRAFKGKTETLLGITHRTIKAAIANPGSSTILLNDNSTWAFLVLFAFRHIDMKSSYMTQIRHLSPPTLQGSEADVLLMAPHQLIANAPLRKVLQLSLILLGRTKVRVESREQVNPKTPTAFSILQENLNAYQFDTIQERNEVGIFQKFLDSFPNGTRIREGMTHITTVNPKTGSTRHYFHFLGRGLRHDLSQSVLAASKRWAVRLVHIQNLKMPGMGTRSSTTKIRVD